VLAAIECHQIALHLHVAMYVHGQSPLSTTALTLLQACADCNCLHSLLQASPDPCGCLGKFCLQKSQHLQTGEAAVPFHADMEHAVQDEQVHNAAKPCSWPASLECSWTSGLINCIMTRINTAQHSIMKGLNSRAGQNPQAQNTGSAAQSSILPAAVITAIIGCSYISPSPAFSLACCVSCSIASM